MRLDHLAIAAQTLDDGVAWVEDKLGVAFLQGGKHARYGTHNRLLGLNDGLYLEVIAIDPEGQSDGPRWFGLDDFAGPPRLVNWICEPDDFDAKLRYSMKKVAMQRAGLNWDMGVPQDGSLPLGGAYPTILKWHCDIPPGQSLPSSGCGLKTLTIYHPDADQLKDEVGLKDTRVMFAAAPEVKLVAEFDTPTGPVVL